MTITIGVDHYNLAGVVSLHSDRNERQAVHPSISGQLRNWLVGYEPLVDCRGRSLDCTC